MAGWRRELAAVEPGEIIIQAILPRDPVFQAT